jgi:hypothetical protein
MPKFRHYSPELSRKLVGRLYRRAKDQDIPMTVLANQLLEEALSKNERVNRVTEAKDRHTMKPT